MRDLPVLDGACAVLIATSRRRRGARQRCQPAGSCHRHAHRTDRRGRAQPREPQAGRTPRPALWAKAGITDPLAEIDVGGDIRCVLLVRSDVGWRTWGVPEGGAGKLTEAGGSRDGWCASGDPSGGVLSSNPIGASGCSGCRGGHAGDGPAGGHQVDGARTALGHAYGGGSQVLRHVVVGSDKPGQRKART